MKKKILLLILSFILSFILGESTVRILNLTPEIIPITGWHFVDNLKLVYEEKPYTNTISGDLRNNLGFKDSNFIKDKPSNLVRIIMLGDSITEGVWVKYGKTFCDHLENLLNKEAIEKGSNLKYEVMNFGVIGYNLEAKIETLKTKAIQFKPDIVILNYFDDDLLPLSNHYAILIDSKFNEKQKLFILKKYVWDKYSLIKRILYKSKLYILLQEVLLNKNIYPKQSLNNVLEKIGRPSPNFKKIIYYNFLEIKKLQAKYKFKFLICLHPNLIHGYAPSTSAVVEQAKKFSFPYFYMWDYYKNKVEDMRYLQFHDRPKDTAHPNELGHAIISEAIFEELKKNNFIDKDL